MSPAMTAAVERLVADAERQGFPRHVADASALAAIAAQLAGIELTAQAPTGSRKRRRGAAPQEAVA